MYLPPDIEAFSYSVEKKCTVYFFTHLRNEGNPILCFPTRIPSFLQLFNVAPLQTEEWRAAIKAFSWLVIPTFSFRFLN